MNQNLANATSSDYTNYQPELTIGVMNTDGPTGQKEFEWTNVNWSKYWGFFNTNPELKSALILKSIWNVGKGYTADPETTVILDHISGRGKVSFRDILFNMDLMKNLTGDSYAEIIRDEDTGTLLNLKPLDGNTIKHIANDQGIIIRYEQTTKISEKEKVKITFEPEQILHFSNNTLADQIHGISDIVALEKTILSEEENFQDIKKLMHHQAVPMILWKLKTDDKVKIDAFVGKINNAKKYGEDIFIPDDENLLTWEVVQLSIPQAIFEWRNDIRNKFYRAIGIPQIVPGAGGNSTESESKVIYLAFEQIVEHYQSYIEEQIWNQLGLRINLIPPASLANDLQTDQAKDGPMSMQQSEMKPGVNE
jgi:hypothetical protein